MNLGLEGRSVPVGTEGGLAAEHRVYKSYYP